MSKESEKQFQQNKPIPENMHVTTEKTADDRAVPELLDPGANGRYKCFFNEDKNTKEEDCSHLTANIGNILTM